MHNRAKLARLKLYPRLEGRRQILFHDIVDDFGQKFSSADNMASFLRGRQSNIQNDLSAAILPGLFSLDDQARYGINSQISALAYDPVQSLLAVGTSESPFGSGQIYIFGQKRVQVTFALPRRASIRTLQFCADRLVSLDSRNEVTVWSLPEKKKLASYSPPGLVTALVTDPTLHWAFIGLQNGDVVVYDFERERLAPLRLPNYWRERNPRARILSVVCMHLHPRDVGQLLIGYTEGAVIYSFKQNMPIKFFKYEIPPGASGGNSDPNTIETLRTPRLTQALWHPSGIFIVTAHDDSSLVFWDSKDGRILLARTLQEIHINKPTGGGMNSPSAYSLKSHYTRIAWCAKDNADDTALLIAGGQPTNSPTQGLTFVELGIAPVYATSSWQILSEYFQGKNHNSLPTPPGAELVDFCLIPRASPHFAGAQDPIAIIVLLSSGELITLTFPSGHPISPTNQLHPSLAFVHPFITSLAAATVDRTRWLGMTEKRQQGPPILRGGAEAKHPLRRYEARNIIQIAHGDGTVRIFDAGQADEIENSTVLQVDMARALARYENLDISKMSMASATGEFAAGTQAGEVVIFRWASNAILGSEAQTETEARPGTITSLMSRGEPTLKEGLQPFCLYYMGQGAISALKVSDVGFVGVGGEGGSFSIVDLRGPTVIHSSSMADFSKPEKRSNFIRRGHGSQGPVNPEWPVAIEFGVMTLEGDDYSSILCFVGTNLGRVATFKILPGPSGGYRVQFSGATTLNGRVISICPISAETGKPAVASGATVAGLREGRQVNGVLVVVTDSEARIFKPASSKGPHKTWEDFLCDSANVTHFESHGYALVGIFGDCKTRAYALPSLKEIGVAGLSMLDRSRMTSAIVTSSGHISGFVSPSEIAVLGVWGTGLQLSASRDALFNPEALIPPRPSISGLQWIAGTQYLSAADLDILIGGPDCSSTKRVVAAGAGTEQSQAEAGAGPSRANPASSQEGWGEYMTRQLNERTQKLNIMGDSMDKAMESSAGWANDASKYIDKQKRNLLMRSVTGKFF